MALYDNMMRDFTPPGQEYNLRFQEAQKERREQKNKMKEDMFKRKLDMQEAFMKNKFETQKETRKNQFDIQKSVAMEREKARLKSIENKQKTQDMIRLNLMKGDPKPPEGSGMSLPGGKFGDVEGKEIPFGPQPKEESFPYVGVGGAPFKNPLFKATTKDSSDLTGEQEVKARSLARKLYGVRGARDGLPAIAKLMKEGKSVDEVEDMIRFSGQSEQFTGVIRSAAQEVLINTSPAIAERTLDFMDDELSKGNITGVKSKLKRISRKTAGTEVSKQVMGKERTVEFLQEIQENLDVLERSGVDTNIFTGSIEGINKMIGRVNNPELRKVATKIATAIQTYRRGMSGVAFSVPESEEYKNMFPSISRTANFNRANIEALRETMQGDLDNFYSLSMGEENYRGLFNKPQGQSQNGMSDLDAQIEDIKRQLQELPNGE